MKLKLTFKGPNVVSIVTKEESIKVGHGISFVTPMMIWSLDTPDACR